MVDGHQLDSGDLEFATQLTDLCCAAAAALARPMDRFAAVHELRVWARVEMAKVTFSALRAAERRRGPAELDSAPWIDRSERAAAPADCRGGMPDSCYMWRRDGALDRARRPHDPSRR